MKINFERTSYAIRVALTGADGYDRVVDVDRASDAFSALALDIDTTAFIPLDVLFAFPRVVSVEAERRGRDDWGVEVTYWRGSAGTLGWYTTHATSLAEALARCLRVLAD